MFLHHPQCKSGAKLCRHRSSQRLSQIRRSPERGTVRYWESEIKGFVAHVQKTTTTLYYDRDNRRHLIGKFPTVRLDRAREAVRDLDFRLRRGYARHVTQSNPMIGDMLNQYCSRPTLRSDKYGKRSATPWRMISSGRTSGRSNHPEMCRDAHQRLGKRGPVAANSALQAFNTVWNFARRLDRNLP